MSATFVFTEEAENQLLDIIDHISAESEEAAVRVRQAIHDAASRLAGTPEMGHTRGDLTRRPVKLWNVFSYLLVYDPESKPLTVIAVLHGARDVEQLLKNS